ncbi:hypothetical protein ACP4OV_022717 [Aristida adscensionis]
MGVLALPSMQDRLPRSAGSPPACTQTHVHGIQQILLQLGLQFCEPVEVDTPQLSGRVRLDQDIFQLSFADDETVPDNVTFEGELFKWLTTPVPKFREATHMRIIQNSISQGYEILQKIVSIQNAFILKEKVDDHVNEETANDAQIQKMAADLNCVKKKLVNLCRIDYHSLILQAMHMHLKNKFSQILQKGSDDLTVKSFEGITSTRKEHDDASCSVEQETLRQRSQVVQPPMPVNSEHRKEPLRKSFASAVSAIEEEGIVETKFLDFLRC